MTRSFLQVYIHFNWHTRNNAPIIQGELERFIHDTIRQTAEELGLLMLAVNSAWNHTHSLFGWNTTTAIETMVREMKCRSSKGWNELIRAGKVEGPRLEWQRGIGGIGIERKRISTTIAYIDKQKEHHSSKNLDPELEKKRP